MNFDYDMEHESYTYIAHIAIHIYNVHMDISV